MAILFSLIWVVFIYFFVKECNKKYEYQGNPMLYAVLTFFIGGIGALGFYFGNKFNKEDKVIQKMLCYALGIMMTMFNILMLFI